MTRIVLARHGRPVMDARTPIAGHELAAWLAVERDAPLDAASRPGAELERLAAESDRLIVSPLRRSRDSGRLLRPGLAPTVEADVTEAPLPSAFRSSLRLPPAMWTGIARAAWLCGWSAGVESFPATRRRAARAAQRLNALALEGSDLLVIGHGLMNALVARSLRALGWAGPVFPSRTHWEYGSYSN